MRATRVLMAAAVLALSVRASAQIGPTGGSESFSGITVADGTRLDGTSTLPANWKALPGPQLQADSGFFFVTGASNETTGFGGTKPNLDQGLNCIKMAKRQSGTVSTDYSMHMDTRGSAAANRVAMDDGKVTFYAAMHGLPDTNGTVQMGLYMGNATAALPSGDRWLRFEFLPTTKDMTVYCGSLINNTTPSTARTIQLGTGTSDDNEYAADTWVKLAIEWHIATGTPGWAKFYKDDVLVHTEPLIAKDATNMATQMFRAVLWQATTIPAGSFAYFDDVTFTNTVSSVGEWTER